jgi:hypothetical protein
MRRIVSGLFVARMLGTLALGGCTRVAPDCRSGYAEAESVCVAPTIAMARYKQTLD